MTIFLVPEYFFKKFSFQVSFKFINSYLIGAVQKNSETVDRSVCNAK